MRIVELLGIFETEGIAFDLEGGGIGGEILDGKGITGKRPELFA